MLVHKSVTSRNFSSNSVMPCAAAQLLASKMIICRHRSCFFGLLLSSSPLLLGYAILQCAYEKCLFCSNYFNFSSSFLHSHNIFSVRGGTKCVSAALLPCSFAYFITFNFKSTVYKILSCLLHILLGK